jgi:hypothetical protein
MYLDKGYRHGRGIGCPQKGYLWVWNPAEDSDQLIQIQSALVES